jgi:hypothetical protein
MQNCAFVAAFWQAINSIPGTRSDIKVSNWYSMVPCFFQRICYLHVVCGDIKAFSELPTLGNCGAQQEKMQADFK